VIGASYRGIKAQDGLQIANSEQYQAFLLFSEANVTETVRVALRRGIIHL
jgi:hypothetical protein